MGREEKFATEHATYARCRQEIERCAAGKVVVVHGEQWDGPHESEELALSAGYKRWRAIPLLVRRVEGGQPPRDCIHVTSRA